MGIITFIFGLLIGIQKNINKIATSLVAGLVSFLFYIMTLTPVRSINIETVLLVFFSIVTPLVFGTWLISIFTKRSVDHNI